MSGGGNLSLCGDGDALLGVFFLIVLYTGEAMMNDAI